MANFQSSVLASEDEHRSSSRMKELEFNRAHVGKRIWISGATRGLGLKICEGLVDNECIGILMTDIADISVGESVAKTLTQRSIDAGHRFAPIIRYRQVDIRNVDKIEQSMREAIRLFNGLDTVVNCAGVIDEQNLEHTMSVNAIGCIRTSERALNIFNEMNYEQKKKAKPTILNIASASGVFPLPKGEYYTTSKHAVVGFSKSFALRANKMGVRVLCLCPAWIDIGMGALALKTNQDMVKATGLSILKVEKVVNVVLFLLASNRYAGEVVYISGDHEPCLARVSIRKRLVPTPKL